MITNVFVQRIEWNGITVEISYEPNWMGGLTEAFGEPLAHLQIQSVSPERAALPVAFVRDWLDEAANDPTWKAAQDAARQLALF